MDDFHCSLFILPEKLQYDIKSVVKQSVLWWSALLSFILKARLQTVRENSGYTQEAFAEALDIGVEHYRKI